MKPTISLFSSLFFLLISWSCQPPTPQSAERLNIVLLFADDHRASTLFNEDVYMPRLRQLMGEGVTFPNAHIMGGNNGAVCTPSRAMLLTGRRLGQLPGNGHNIKEDHMLLGQLLGSEGYDTYGIGKWHNNRDAFSRAFSDGEAIFMGGMYDPWNTPLFHYDSTGKYTDSRRSIDNFFHDNVVDTLRGEYAISGKHATEIFADEAIQFLQTRQPEEEPFFLYVAFTSPHDPRTTPQAFMDLYADQEIPLPPNFMEEHPFDNGELIVRDEQLAETPRVASSIQRHIREYYAMVSHLDHEVGRIMDQLKAQGLDKNTLFIFAGDNGLAVGQHGLMGKQNVYQHSVNIPLIMRGPDIPSGESRESFCYTIDIFPTICAYTQVSKPEGIDGISLLPAISENASIREVLHFQYKKYQASIREENWKLIRYEVKGEQHLQLFDLDADPWELENLADNQPEKVQSLLAASQEWVTAYGIPFGDQEE
ncbi:MAG: sulfatase-like hydrolase/transferase [Bacteroidota bacterium]